MIKNKKGFSLIELLVVIAIIGVILLISFPVVDNLIKKNNKSKYDVYRNVIEEASKEYMDDLGFIVSGCYEIKTEEKSSYEVLEEEGLLSNFNEDCKDTKVYVLSDENGNITDYKINLVCGKEEVLGKEYTSDTCNYNIVQYKESFGGKGQDKSGAHAPEIKNNMIPVKYNGEDWVVADIDNVKFSSVFEEDYSWYNYNKGYWANTIIVKQEAYKNYVNDQGYIMGKKVNNEDTISWWVWIPRFEYKIQWGEYMINFLSTQDEITQGYQIAEAFVDPSYNSSSTNKKLNKNYAENNGFWVSKYELGKEGDTYVVKKLEDTTKYITNATALAFLAYGQGIDGSHTIRNTEWNTVALLSLSKYGSKDDRSEYTTSNYSGVYNMQKDEEFTAGNLRGLSDFNINVTCKNSCNENNESVVEAEYGLRYSERATSVYEYHPYSKDNRCSFLACIGFRTPSQIYVDHMDIYNIDYKWYNAGELITKYTYVDSNFVSTTVSSNNIEDSDAFFTYTDFFAKYPRYSFIRENGIWSLSPDYDRTNHTYLWTFRGERFISSYNFYNDMTMDSDEMLSALNEKCQPTITCTDGDTTTKKEVIYSSSFTKYPVRTRVVMH